MADSLPAAPREDPDSALAQRQLRAEKQLGRAVALITDAGRTLLENGGEVFRAQQTMEIMARALAVPDFHCYVLTNGIFVSAGGALHEIRHIPAAAIRLDRVEAVNALSRRLAAGELDLAGAEAALQMAAALPGYRVPAQTAAGALGAAGFAFLFGGGWVEMLLAALAGTAELAVPQLLRRAVHGPISRIFALVASAAAGALTALLCAAVRPLDVDTAIIGALMILTPGVAMTMGVRDLVHADYLSGTIRLFDAVLVAGSLACGVALAWLAAQPLTALLPAAYDAVAVITAAAVHSAWARALWWAGQGAAAAFATVCFAVIFQAPRRHMPACGVTGAVGWLAYLLAAQAWGLAAPAATLLAALPLAAAARWFAVRHKAPATVFLLCGIFPLVPGAGIYHTACHFLRDERALFAASGGETVKIALALALGIALVFSVPLPKRKA